MSSFHFGEISSLLFSEVCLKRVFTLESGQPEGKVQCISMIRMSVMQSCTYLRLVSFFSAWNGVCLGDVTVLLRNEVTLQRCPGYRGVLEIRKKERTQSLCFLVKFQLILVNSLLA